MLVLYTSFIQALILGQLNYVQQYQKYVANIVFESLSNLFQNCLWSFLISLIHHFFQKLDFWHLVTKAILFMQCKYLSVKLVGL